MTIRSFFATRRMKREAKRREQKVFNDVWEWYYHHPDLHLDFYEAAKMARRDLRLQDLGVPETAHEEVEWRKEV